MVPITNKYGITVTRRDSFIQEYYINDESIEWNSLVAYSKNEKSEKLERHCYDVIYL